MMYLNLSELERVFSGHWLWSSQRFNLAWFRRKDHLGDSSIPLDEAVRQLVAHDVGTRPGGPICILTQLRYYGYCFNPVSFYYCFDPGATRVETIVAEVHNTPWGEEFCYVLPESKNEGTPEMKAFRLDKVFHVSPFMGMDINYEWKFSVPENTISVEMTSFEKGNRLFEAYLKLEREDITSRNLTFTLSKHPFMTAKVIGAIYWQALRLWLKGAPFYTHPQKGGTVRGNHK